MLGRTAAEKIHIVPFFQQCFEWSINDMSIYVQTTGVQVKEPSILLSSARWVNGRCYLTILSGFVR
jgi:hypothetical protein